MQVKTRELLDLMTLFCQVTFNAGPSLKAGNVLFCYKRPG